MEGKNTEINFMKKELLTDMIWYLHQLDCLQCLHPKTHTLIV